MFPSFIGILDIQSWWEVPSIAYFCSLFRTAFNLLDFDIEELEEALLTDGTEESSSSLLTELIVRLLNGCLGNNDISAFNYQMYLRRLFRRKCQETGRYNPFNTDIDFQFLPLRTKVEILYALCDFRLDADDVFDLFKNLEAESLRVEPLGFDDNGSAFWYFYGTRLYREDIVKKPKGKNKKKKNKCNKKHGWFYGDDWLEDDDTERVWQVVCFTEADWAHLTKKFSKATSKVEKKLYRSLSQNFLPEIPRLFQEKERLQRKRLLEFAPRRTSTRVLQKIKQKEEETKQSESEQREQEEVKKGKENIDRENRAKRRNLLKSKSTSSSSSESSSSPEMPQKITKRPKSLDKTSKTTSTSVKEEPPPEPPVKTGRKTNNSLASATGQILISDNDEPVNSTRKKLKPSQIFSQSEEDIKTDMYKVLEQLTNHEDAWPFMDPVEEEYAPNYYAVIRRPMDLRKMEERLDNAYYTDYSMFKADFKLIVNNCRLYNGQDNEYTVMVENLQNAFDKLTEKYINRLSSSDEEIAVEYQLPTPSRKHKIKSSESPDRVKRKKRKSHSETVTSKSGPEAEDEPSDETSPDNKESHKSKDEKIKKKRKGRHRHSKHSKSHKKTSQHKSKNNEGFKKSKHSKKHMKENKKLKQKKKKPKVVTEEEQKPNLERSISQESLESSNRSRSASPLPSIHSPTPSPTEPDPPNDPDFFKDKYDKIKERRRTTVKDAWESLIDHKNKTADKQKQNLRVPEKDKNQKLRETIEKLKAKNEKYKENSIFNSLFTSGGQSNVDKSIANTDSNHTNDSLNKDNEDSESSDDDFDDTESQKDKHGKGTKRKRPKKNHTTKNEIASEALEQAVKDISKWLDDAPKASTISSPCNSPAPTTSTEDQDNSRQDDELYDKGLLSRKEASRKRPSSREPRLMKRREVQRTIDRLQPGKSKGNLIANVATTQKVEEQLPSGSLNKFRDINKSDESSPKLSLGSVLPTVEFTLGNDHSFDKTDDKVDNVIDIAKSNESESKVVEEESVAEKIPEEVVTEPKKDEEKEEEIPVTTAKLSQEKATPNLSAWFKAFGAPKSTAVGKKKTEDGEQEEKPVESTSADNKSTSPKNITKYDSPVDEISPNPEGGDSPLPNPRHRRTSTGSSVSERSSFSQDLDSPRHQISHTSPLLRSPASPRTDEFQKITYPIINGTIRAGFYQDTTSLKSSPEKSCSPREAPQSPYSPYAQHVYASNNMGNNSMMQSPNYFIDHNKSPMPTYSQNQLSPYYDATRPLVINKVEPYQQNQYASRYSPAHTSYAQERQPSFAHEQNMPQNNNTATPTSAPKMIPDPKTALFPVKKRIYNEVEVLPPTKKITDNAMKDDLSMAQQNKEDYQKIVQSMHMPSLPTTSVDMTITMHDKTDVNKANDLREKNTIDLIDRQLQNLETHDNVGYTSNENMNNKKKDVENMFTKPSVTPKKDNIDPMHVGYGSIDNDRQKHNDHPTHSQLDYNSLTNISKSTASALPKGYGVDAIAMNLGLNHAQKTINKNVMETEFLDSENQDKMSVDLLNQSFSEFDNLPLSTTPSLSEINIDMNKKLFNTNTSQSLNSNEYENWKSASQINRDSPPADLSTSFVDQNKQKSDMSCTNTNPANFSKNFQHQHQPFQNYTMAHSNLSRNPELPQSMSSELRIPNPRGHLKNETMVSHANTNVIVKNSDNNNKTTKSNKSIENHPLLGSFPYKPPFMSHGSLEPFLNIPGMFDRYPTDERYYSRLASTPLSRDKSYAMAQMLSKSGSTNAYQNSCVSIFSHALPTDKELGYYKNPQTNQADLMPPTKECKKKKSTATKQSQGANQSYQPSTSNADVLSSAKSGMVPGSAFNFGTASNMGLGSGLYGDNGGFSIEDFRNSTANQLMAGNYMAAAAASHQRANKEGNQEKLAKPAHQNRSHTPGSSFPFIDHTQVRPGYPFVGADPSSPLYQQYLQRHQEHLLRQTGAQIMSLYPGGYPGNLGVRQHYDSINRPSWL